MISSFWRLNIVQFIVTLNDSIFRLVVAYSLIDLLGAEKSNTILSISAALFVIPFLLFAMPSGQLADRFSKKRVIVWTLWVEIAFMILGLLGVIIKDQFTLYFALFLIALQASVFNPSKYAILPEIVKEEELSRVNGIMTFFTYLAVLFGTFLASFILDLTERNYALVVLLCIACSILALFMGLGIEKTSVKNPTKKVKFFIIKDVYENLKIAKRYPHLLLAIGASSCFLFTAGFTQLNLIPFGIQSLDITDVQTGYVYLAAAFGLGLGAFLVGLLSHKTIRLGISIWGAFGTTASYLLLYVTQHHLIASTLLFFSIGMHGGLFIVPLDAYIQYASPEKDRGSVIAAGTFLGFLAVLLSAGVLALFGDVFFLTAAEGFFLIGLFTLIVSLWIVISLKKVYRS